MAVEWPRVSVSDVATAVIGGTPRRDTPEYWNGDLPWASAKDVACIPGRYLDEVQECITEEGLNASAAKLMPQGTILITARGTVGALAQLRRKMAFNQTCYAILSGSKIDNDFLFYALKGSMAEMRSLTYGTVFETITKKSFDDWVLQLPPFPEQRAIAHILGTLDDKIELNRRMNQTLEGMARALFKSWFVDFDPVRAKMDGRWRRGQSLLGMPAELFDLFPDGMVSSELGEIPAGWEIGALNDVIELLSGGTPKTAVAEYWNGDIPWYTAKDAPAPSDVFVLDTEKKITMEGVENSATRILPEGTTVITARGTVGKIAFLGIPMSMNQTCYGIRGASGYPDFFTYLNIRMTVDELQQRTHGTVFDTVTRQTFKLVDKVIPPVKVACAFESMIEPTMGRILVNLRDSLTLATLRDTLMPKLISGKLQVTQRRKRQHD